MVHQPSITTFLTLSEVCNNAGSTVRELAMMKVLPYSEMLNILNIFNMYYLKMIMVFLIEDEKIHDQSQPL